MSIVDGLNERGVGMLLGLIGIEVVDADEGRLELRQELMAPNGHLHGATIVAFADTSCGYGTFVSLPEGAERFRTVELKSNLLGTRRAGVIGCEARMVHGGRTTQDWDTTLTYAKGGKPRPSTAARR